ncbi:MAG TPA: exopolysaccharide transport family protein [Xanthobacteraceae bacterium]|nr:exopolysaccharide transport family protein [Xanthobacteraceae bacterium]
MFEASSHMPSAVVSRRDPSPGFAALPPIDVQKIWSVLWRGKITIVLSTIVAVALAAAFVLLTPHKYTATTQILIDPMDLRAAQSDISPTIPQSDAAVLQVESQARVIASDNVLRRVVASEGLDHDPEFMRGALAEKYGPLAALNELQRRVLVKRSERTYVVDVSVTSEDPDKAARIANAIAQAYLTEQIEARSNAARQISQALKGRLQELQTRVRDAEQKVEAYKASHNIVGSNGELVNEQQLTSLNAQLSASRARTSEAKARLDQVESVLHSKTPVGAFPEAVQSPTISLLRSQYAEIMRRDAEQKSSLGERHPAVIEIEAQGARLQKLIEDEVARIAASDRAEYERAKADEDMLSRQVDGLKNTAVSTNESLVGLRELERDVQASRAVYESFLVRSRETGEQEQVDTKNIRIISKADRPIYRSSPPPSLIVGLAAMLLGFASGVGIVIMRGSPEEAAPRPAKTRVETKAKAPANFGRLGAFAKKLWEPPATPSAIPVLATLPNVDIAFGLDAVEDPHSRFAREIQKVYEAVRASHKKRGNPSVLVVAADDEDDTASVALMLAAAAAATQRVLLIDTDLKRRTLSAIDAEESEAGLVDVAVGRLELSDVIVRDRDTNVNLLPFVSPNSRRDRRISDADIKEAFDKTKRFDMVIVAAVDVNRDPSARFFAGLVDHIVLVARADERDDDAVELFVARLGADAQKIRGAVLTGVEAA